MEINIYYTQKPTEENYLDSWSSKVHINKYPTIKDVKKEYIKLPIDECFWKSWRFIDVKEVPKDERTLEAIFALFNNYTHNPMADGKDGKMQKWLKDHNVVHTSMSVGDVIQLDNEFFVCAMEGWKKLKED